MSDVIKISPDAYSCFGCNYIGIRSVETEDGDACPNCGTIEGDGFGQAENDPRIDGDELPAWAWTDQEKAPQ